MKIIKIKSSHNGKIVKFDILLDDDYVIQNVFFISKRYNTVSLSTQVGCPIKCGFCLSGSPFIRNLSIHELLCQLSLVEKYLRKNFSGLKIQSVKLFGIGEPLLNLDNVIPFIKNISKKYFNISICTVGISEGITQLIKEGIKAELFISLNGTSKSERTKISIFFAGENFKELVSSIKEYRKLVPGRNKVQINYLVLGKINDSFVDMKKLGKMFGKEYKINLKKICLDKRNRFRAENCKSITKLKEALELYNPNVYISKGKGSDIHAAPGQLEARKWK